ncbi:hypothetical protein [Lunatimonas salinarum]|uniref:hypothetical protein n=1 Tax=Lunatimonas salinarum TaxID=1774590 RepID=UPI001ADFBC2F|nr:hypothetical protein [Lunatimonas salinarum]
MKKLNLEKLKLAAEDVLQRDEMTTIYGGSGGSGGTCSVCYLYEDSQGTILIDTLHNPHPGLSFSDCHAVVRRYVYNTGFGTYACS